MAVQTGYNHPVLTIGAVTIRLGPDIVEIEDRWGRPSSSDHRVHTPEERSGVSQSGACEPQQQAASLPNRGAEVRASKHRLAPPQSDGNLAVAHEGPTNPTHRARASST